MIPNTTWKCERAARSRRCGASAALNWCEPTEIACDFTISDVERDLASIATHSRNFDSKGRHVWVSSVAFLVAGRRMMLLKAGRTTLVPVAGEISRTSGRGAWNAGIVTSNTAGVVCSKAWDDPSILASLYCTVLVAAA